MDEKHKKHVSNIYIKTEENVFNICGQNCIVVIDATDKLQRVMNAAARVVSGTRNTTAV